MIIATPANSRRIPTILGIIGTVALVLVVAVSVRSVGQITKLFSQAETPTLPSFVGTANVTDVGATVYWVTDKDTAGSVFYGKSVSLGDGVAVDDRDLSSQNNKYPAHFVHIAGLKPDTKYFFKVGVGTQTYGDADKNGAPYEFTTGGALSTAPLIDPIFGKVTDVSGAPAAGAVVVWEVSGAEKVAALAKNDGNYVLPIGNARTTGDDSYLSPADGLAETVSLNGGGGSPLATITCQVGQDRPLPTVKLGETTDCKKKTTAGSGFKAPASNPAALSSGTVTLNMTDGQTVSTPLPTFSGKAGPNQVVTITVNSETPYSGTVQADASGNWSWTPPANLAPGQHTVVITVTNADGTTQTVTKIFTVSAGASILPITSGTPSATLTHLECVSSACSTVTGVGPDSCAIDADCVVAPPPTAPVAPAVTTPPPAQPLPPQTGSTENTLAMLTLGLIFATLGGVIIFRKNGSEQ